MKKKKKARKPRFPVLVSVISSIISAVMYDYIKSPDFFNIYEYVFLWIISILFFIMVMIELAYFFEKKDGDRND